MPTELEQLRASATREALRRARDAVPHVAELDAELGGRLEVRLDLLAGDIEEKLAQDPSSELVERGDALVAETLAFVSGAAARRLGLDGGISALALAWLDRLSDAADLHQVGVVIPASTEFTGMLTQIVRLRLPNDGIWSLPVAVHEYGHSVGSTLARRAVVDGIATTVVPIEDLAHAAGADADFPRLYFHGHELFADALATVIAGPAYPRYCVHHRFDPAGAQELTATHPAPARRIRMQLRALTLLQTGTQAVYLESEREALRARWASGVAEAGQSAEVAADPQLDALEDQLIGALEDPSLKALRYGDHVAARQLAEQPLDQAGAAASVAAALNAAWLRRLKGQEPVEAIARACETLVKRVLGDG